MWKNGKFLSLIALMLLGGIASGAEKLTLAPGKIPADLPALEVTQSFPDAEITIKEPLTIQLPALPHRQGYIIVLRISMVGYTSQMGGCNFNAAISVNGKAIERFTAGGDERLIGRNAMYELKHYGSRKFNLFMSGMISTMFAPDFKGADYQTKDGKGSYFLFDISDMVRGVDGNLLHIRNLRPAAGKRPSIFISNVAVGYISKDKLPKVKSSAPQRKELKEYLEKDGVRLSWAANGGFSVRLANGTEVIAESGLGMGRQTPYTIEAVDVKKTAAEPAVTVTRFGDRGFEMSAKWSEVTLTRRVEFVDGIIRWHDKWQNTGKSIRGIPWRHRFYLRNETTRFFLGGGRESDNFRASNTANPTYFLESDAKRGSGFGIAVESDWARLLSWWRISGGIGEIYTETLALAPQCSFESTITITPVVSGGYWKFINALRDRWKVNGFTLERAVFWSYARAGGKTPEEVYRRSLAHLGPVYVATWPWLRSTADKRRLKAGYPKLPAGSKPSPGPLKDLDIDKHLRFEQRADAQKLFKKEIDDIRRAAPNVKVMQWMHPSMEVVYLPLIHRWPYYHDVVIGADGKPFWDHNYSMMSLGKKYVEQGWRIAYFLPAPGSKFLQYILDDAINSMDVCGSEGIYSDEMSWALTTRGYSRYDYRNWDGYSADLDEKGNVIRLKSDNAKTTEVQQLLLISAAVSRGKLVLGNGAPALKSTNQAPAVRFTEGGYALLCGGHLNRVPLVLGNFGDQKTLPGIMQGVRKCTMEGSIYSPMACNLLLKSPDNFVTKLYPITVREIGPGFIFGEERMHAAVSGSYNWPGHPAKIRLFVYNSKGERIDADRAEIQSDGKVTIDVPEEGLVIAEIVREEK